MGADRKPNCVLLAWRDLLIMKTDHLPRWTDRLVRNIVEWKLKKGARVSFFARRAFHNGALLLQPDDADGWRNSLLTLPKHATDRLADRPLPPR